MSLNSTALLALESFRLSFCTLLNVFLVVSGIEFKISVIFISPRPGLGSRITRTGMGGGAETATCQLSSYES